MRIKRHDSHFVLLDICVPIIRNWATIRARLCVVAAVVALSQFGCALHQVHEADRNLRPLSLLREEGPVARTAQRQPVFSQRSVVMDDLVPEHHEEHEAGSLTLETLEMLAREHNPTLVQALAQVEGERAKALQAGLYPNPRIGYIGEQIGVNGTIGEFQGGFIQQEIVTAGKLRLSREKYRARASAAAFQALAQEYRVINEVRIRYYRTLGAQKRLDVQLELLEIAKDRLLTVQEMFNVGQANQADRHQARTRLAEQQLKVGTAENRLDLEWEWLMAVVGVFQPRKPLKGELEGGVVEIEWETALRRVLAGSPELGLVRAALKEDEITVEREQREPVPNLMLSGSAGHNDETRGTVFGVGASIELPVFDWNQGTIRQAQADLKRQWAEVRITELRLRRSLASQVQRHRTTRQHIKTYAERILPEARERYAVTLRSYEKNRGDWPSVLDAREDLFRRRLRYLDYLVASRETQVVIDGWLLADGLTSPAGAPEPGHIDAVPKPR